MIKLHCVFLLCIFLIHPVIMKGQVQKSDSTTSLSSAKIKKMDNYLSVKLSGSNDILGFSVNSDNNVYYDIQPNMSLVGKLSIHYRFISGVVKYTPKFLPGNDDDRLKGKTKARSYQIKLDFNHFMQGVSYTNVNGFYLQNTRDFIPGWNEGDDYIKFPELHYYGFDGYTGYKFNPDFSIKALSSQTERQLKSAGSFLTTLFYRYYIVNDKKTLTGLNSSQKSNNLEVVLTASYIYSLVLRKNFYVSAGLTPGAGLIWTKILTRTPQGEQNTHQQNPIYRFEGQAALGYNAERLFGGFQFTTANEWFDQEHTSTIITNKRLTFQLFIGYRFIAPGIVKQSVDNAEQHIPGRK